MQIKKEIHAALVKKIKYISTQGRERCYISLLDFSCVIFPTLNMDMNYLNFIRLGVTLSCHTK